MEGLNPDCPATDSLISLASIGDPDWEAMLRHVLSCSSCRAQMDDVFRLRSTLTSRVEVSSEFVDRVTDQVLRARAGREVLPIKSRSSERLAQLLAATTVFLTLALMSSTAGGATAYGWIGTLMVSLAAGIYLPRFIWAGSFPDEQPQPVLQP